MDTLKPANFGVIHCYTEVVLFKECPLRVVPLYTQEVSVLLQHTIQLAGFFTATNMVFIFTILYCGKNVSRINFSILLS